MCDKDRLAVSETVYMSSIEPKDSHQAYWMGNKRFDSSYSSDSSPPPLTGCLWMFQWSNGLDAFEFFFKTRPLLKLHIYVCVCVRERESWCVCCHPIYSGRQTTPFGIICGRTTSSRGHKGGRPHSFRGFFSAFLLRCLP